MSTVSSNYMTVADYLKRFDKDRPTTKWELDAIKEGQELAARISQYYAAEPLIFYDRHTDNNKNVVITFRGVQIFLMHPLRIRVKYHKAKFDFFSLDEWTFNYLDDFDRQKACAALKEPNKIGVLSSLNENKIKKWVSYWEQRIAALRKANDEGAAKIKAFKDSMKGLPVHWDGPTPGTKGSITRGGLTFEFEIVKSYINTNIKVNYGMRTLQDFLDMSDNKARKLYANLG